MQDVREAHTGASQSKMDIWINQVSEFCYQIRNPPPICKVKTNWERLPVATSDIYMYECAHPSLPKCDHTHVNIAKHTYACHKEAHAHTCTHALAHTKELMHTKILLRDFIFICLYECNAWEVQKMTSDTWNWSYRWLSATWHRYWELKSGLL